MTAANDLHRDLYTTIRLVRPIHLNVHRFVEHLLGDGELSVSTRAVLEATIELERATTADISRHLSLKRQQVERLVGPLADAGFIDHEPDPTDRRARLWHATDLGRTTFATLHLREVTAVAELCHDLDPADIAIAARVMATIDERLRGAVQAIGSEVAR